MPLVYVGGLVARKKIDEVLNHGFEAVQMGRALLNEPDFVNRMRREENARCNCRHSNYCIARMYTLDMACHQRLKEELPPCLKKKLNGLKAKDENGTETGSNYGGRRRNGNGNYPCGGIGWLSGGDGVL